MSPLSTMHASSLAKACDSIMKDLTLALSQFPRKQYNYVHMHKFTSPLHKNISSGGGGQQLIELSSIIATDLSVFLIFCWKC